MSADGGVTAESIPPCRLVGWLRANTRCVPLRVCDRWGFTSAAFRADADAADRLEDPHCHGVTRIIFWAHDRYGGHIRPPDTASPQDAALSAQEKAKRPREPEQAFAMREHLDADGTLRLTLLGDPDLAVAETLSTRLAERKTARRPSASTLRSSL